MYKPSKIKHPSVRNPGKNKKNGDPAYASGTTPPAPAFTETAANKPEPPAKVKEQPAAAEATDGSAPATTAAPVTDSHTEPASGKTAEEAHKPIVNEDEQKKVVNQPASSAASTDDNTEQY